MKLVRFRFTTRILLAITFVFAIAFSIFMGRCRERMLAVEAIDRLQGTYSISTEGPAWLRKLLGDERMFYDLGRVSLSPRVPNFDASRPIDDDALKTAVVHLNAFPGFYKLDLMEASISDDGLLALKRLRNLRHLYLDGTNVTDLGIKTLSEIRTLQRVTLWNTGVTEKGIGFLQDALPNCEIDWEKK